MFSRRFDKLYKNIRWPRVAPVEANGRMFLSLHTVRSFNFHETTRPKLYLGRCLTVRQYSHKQDSCPQCGHSSVSVFKCLQCESLIVPSKETTLFDVLGQKMSYDLTDSELKKVHRKLQTEFHPDKYSQKEASERVKSEKISSLINKAYFTLSNPYERGMYMLQLRNQPVNEGDIQLGTDFLAQIMESNEELENISTREELEKFDSSNEEEIRKLTSLISDAFVANNLSSAKADLNKMKYYISIRNRLKEMERNMV